MAKYVKISIHVPIRSKKLERHRGKSKQWSGNGAIRKKLQKPRRKNLINNQG